MDLTPTRWFVAIGIGCAALAAVSSAKPRVSPRTWSPRPAHEIEEAMNDLRDAAAATQTAVRDYRATQALERWTSAPPAAGPVRVDHDVPPAVAAAARAIVLEQWTRLGPTASAAHAQLFLYVDSTTIPRAATMTGARLVIEPRRLIDVRHALPQATDGERCVALVRLRGTTAAHLDVLRGTPLAGVCGFFAVFGVPGAGVSRWLSATNYAFARQSDWDVARAPSIEPGAFYSLSVGGAQCLTGKANACIEALGTTSATPRDSDRVGAIPMAWVLDGSAARASPSFSGTDAALGDAGSRLLADMVRDLGPERFGRFWRADTTPDSALVAASGTTLDAWTNAWLTRAYGAAPRHPGVEAVDVMWLAAAMPLLVFVAARRRQRVLA